MKNIITIWGLCFCCLAVNGQNTTVEGCNFNTQRSLSISKSFGFKTQKEAEQIVRHILTASGWSETDAIPFNIVQKDNLGTCMATFIDGQKTILYDPVFLQKVQRGFSESNLLDKDWAAIFVMAHEVAHHMKGHLDKYPITCKNVDCEISADDWAAFALYMMGATLEDTQLGIKTYIEKEAATPQYPSKTDRLKTVKISWERTKSKEDARKSLPTTNNADPSVAKQEIEEGIKAYDAKDYTKAARLLLKNRVEVEKNGNAANTLGNIYRYGYGVSKDYYEAVKLFRKSAEQGNALGQNNLGVMYRFGYGVTEDDIEAAKWYRKAAEQGNAPAQYNLGNMYSNGYGVPQDYNEAVNWYRKSADQGNPDGQVGLGYRYRTGYGVPQDYNEAVKWYRKSADQGNPDGQCKLGNMYYSGYGVPQDYNEAVKWYRKAAEQGNAPAQTNLGIMYQYGYSVPQDDIEAVKWYQKAAEQGSAMGQYKLGYMYQYGYGVRQNDIEAVKWYQKAAEQGDSQAQNKLGEMYEKGLGGLTKNINEAVRLYRLAAKQNMEDAKASLKRLGYSE